MNKFKRVTLFAVMLVACAGAAFSTVSASARELNNCELIQACAGGDCHMWIVCDEGAWQVS